MSITILASSYRHSVLAQGLKEQGYSVKHYKNSDSIPDIIESEIIVLPIPSFKKGILNIEGRDISDRELFERIDKKSLVITCNYNATDYNCFDINKYEPFVSQNAIPSAEGALLYAANASNETFFGHESLVIGYGRIGKIIADRLQSAGSRVSFTARNPKDIFMGKSKVFEHISYERLKENIGRFKYVFQTVPHLILNSDLLTRVTGIVVELSSGGIGTDLDFAQKYGLNVIYAPAIPEKLYPETAGKILLNSILSIIEDLNNKLLKEEI